MRNLWKILEWGIVMLRYKVLNVATCSVLDVNSSDMRSTFRRVMPLGGTSRARRLMMAAAQLVSKARQRRDPRTGWTY